MKLKVTLIKSPIGSRPEHRKTVRALGLRKMHQSVEKEKNPMILGMVNAVSHLVTVEEVQ